MKMNKKFYDESKNYYKVLGLSSEATQDEIRDAYRKLASADAEQVKNLNKLKENLKVVEETLKCAKTQEEIKVSEEAKSEILDNIDEIEVYLSEIKEAFVISTSYKDEYDKDRSKYLEKESKRTEDSVKGRTRKIYDARNKAIKTAEKANEMGININEDYYAILGVDSTATADELFDANKIALSKDDADIDKITEAYRVLIDPKKKKAYDNAREAKISYERYLQSKKDAILVERIEEGSIRPHLLSKKAKNIIGGTGVAVLAVVIIVGAFSLTKHFLKNSKNDSKGQTTIENNNDSVDNEILGNIANIESLINIGNLAQMFQNVSNGVVDFDNYYAFPLETIVTEKAEQLQTSLNNAGLVNIKTGLPYEKEELKNIIQYMNGLYIPKSEQDIYDMYTAYIDFVCTLACSEDLCYQINYAGGEKSFKEHIEERAKNPMFIDFVEAANLNDSYGIEYAKWLQDKFYTMLYTTDPKTYNALYNEVWQSFADIIVGNGATFTLDGETYKVTEDALLTKGNTGVASLVTLYLSNLQQPNKQVAINKKFYVKQQYLSANESEQDTYITIDQMINYINPYCEIENASDKVTKPYNGQTWGERLQSNMKAIAYEQFMQTQEENYSILFK